MMRFRVSMKLSLLVLLGVCSWFLTSRIAGKRAWPGGSRTGSTGLQQDPRST